MSVEAREHRFSVDDFHRMAETGILSPDDRLELIDGVVVEMTPTHPPHASTVKRLAKALFSLLGDRTTIGVQDSIVLHDRSQPVPDLSVARYRDDFYGSAHPRPEDMHLLIEVADSSTERDRREKLPLYASAGVPEVWLVVVPEERVEVHRDPQGTRYTTVEVLHRGEAVAPRDFPDVELSVDEILG